MSDMVIDDEIQLEHEEELDRLVFSGENDTPIFESVRVTKRIFLYMSCIVSIRENNLYLMLIFREERYGNQGRSQNL